MRVSRYPEKRNKKKKPLTPTNSFPKPVEYSFTRQMLSIYFLFFLRRIQVHRRTGNM